MKNRKLWGKLLAVAMCMTLAFSTTVSATDVNDTVKTEVQEEAVPEMAEEIEEEDTIEPAAEEGADSETETKEAAGETVEETQETEEVVAAEADVLPTIVEKSVVWTDEQYIILHYEGGSGKYAAENIEFIELDGVIGARKENIDTEKHEIKINTSVSWWVDDFCFDDSKEMWEVRAQYKDTPSDSWMDMELLGKIEIDARKNGEYPTLTKQNYLFDGKEDLVIGFSKGTKYETAKSIYWFDLVDAQGKTASYFSGFQGEEVFETDMNAGMIKVKRSELLERIKAGELHDGEKYTVRIFFCNRRASYSKDATVTINLNSEVPVVAPEYKVNLQEENTVISKEAMETYVEQNKIYDIVISTPTGVVITFPRGSMEMVEGKEEYDFGVELIKDYEKAGKTGFESSDFAFRLNFNYSGQLPGRAKISIPLGKDSKWIGKTLYYFEVKNGAYVDAAKVDENGVYTIRQNHCSDYVGSPVSPEELSGDNSGVPKTGDAATALPYLLLGVGACGILVFRRRFF